jgi:hypothetical protein
MQIQPVADYVLQAGARVRILDTASDGGNCPSSKIVSLVGTCSRIAAKDSGIAE